MSTRTAPRNYAETAPKPATEKQLAFIGRLIVERLEGAYLADAHAILARGINSRLASAWIDTLLAMPKAAKTEAPAAKVAAPSVDVPAGRYAVENGEGILRFYRVDRPTEGRWAGRVFVNVYASDETYPVRGEAGREVLAAIAAAGTREASLRYGVEIGACGICGRTLTDEESRARGIGPVCADKVGW